MSEWKEYKLGEIVTFQRGHDLIRDEMIEGNYEVAGSNGVIGYYNKYTTLGPGITIGRSGNIGTPHFYKNNFWAHNTVLYIKNFNDNCELFIYYFLKTLDFTQFNTGSAVPSLNRNHIHELIVKVPPLPEQKAIASVLGSLDDKIDLLHRQNTTLEQMAETLFRQWFIEEAKEDWEVRKLGDFLQPKKGKNITKSEAIEGDYPVVAGGLEPSCYHIISNTESPVITISSSGANAGYVKLYHTKVWSSDSSYIDKTITPYVFFFYVFLKINQDLLFDKQEGSAQAHIYPSHIMQLEILNIPEIVINNIDNELKPLFEKIKSNLNNIRTLTALRDTLLPKLMSGEVRVGE